MKVEVLGVKIDALPKSEVLRQIAERLGRGEQTFIVTPYSESIVAAQTNPGFRDILNSADFALPDGVGILWAAHFLKLKSEPLPASLPRRFSTPRLRLEEQAGGHPPQALGREKGRGRLYYIWRLLYSLVSIIFSPKSIRDPIPEKISGAEFVWDLAELAAAQNKTIYLLGGFGDTAERAGERLKQKFPGLRIAGTSNVSLRGVEATKQSQDQGIAALPLDRFELARKDEVINRINSSGADFLFVALGPRRQEKWIYENRLKLAPKVLIGLGGTFDYLAGKRPYRPQFWALAGLEWLWRLLTQPWRVGRILRGVFGLIFYAFRNKEKGPAD